MHDSVWNASCEELIRAGWGNHSRCNIPKNWRTRRGPDSPTFGNRRWIGTRSQRQSYAEIRAEREAMRARAWTEEVIETDIAHSLRRRPIEASGD